MTDEITAQKKFVVSKHADICVILSAVQKSTDSQTSTSLQSYIRVIISRLVKQSFNLYELYLILSMKESKQTKQFLVDCMVNVIIKDVMDHVKKDTTNQAKNEMKNMRGVSITSTTLDKFTTDLSEPQFSDDLSHESFDTDVTHRISNMSPSEQYNIVYNTAYLVYKDPSDSSIRALISVLINQVFDDNNLLQVLGRKYHDMSGKKIYFELYDRYEKILLEYRSVESKQTEQKASDIPQTITAAEKQIRQLKTPSAPDPNATDRM